jgi:hypothetical protein
MRVRTSVDRPRHAAAQTARSPDVRWRSAIYTAS